MKDGCLHCELIKAARKWLKNHSASDLEIGEMIGRFTAEAIASLKAHEGKEIEVLILGITYSNDSKERLH